MKYSPTMAIAALIFLSSVLVEPRLWGTSNRIVLANSNYQKQEATVFVNVEDLQEPYMLSIHASPSLSSLSGSISCNGKMIQLLGNEKTKINLSSYLQRGSNDIVIQGLYAPSSTLIEIQLVGAGRQLVQTTSGTGQLNQNLLIEVQ